MDEKYFIYVVKSNEGKFYVGKSTSKAKWYNPCSYFLDQHKKDHSKYEILGKSLLKHGVKGHKVSILYDRELFSIEEAEHKVFDLVKQLESKGKSLNGQVVNPEREQCEDCGKRIKKIYMQEHKDNYCEFKIRDELSELIDI